MKKEFIAPSIEMDVFEKENIVLTSGVVEPVVTNEELAMSDFDSVGGQVNKVTVITL